ncbi:MAG: hypothetical protein ACI4SS_05430 [Clostridia bacterium]
MEKKKCWCYLTYVFPMDDIPPIPFAKTGGQELPPSERTAIEAPSGFEPTWFFNSKFPEDE